MPLMPMLRLIIHDLLWDRFPNTNNEKLVVAARLLTIKVEEQGSAFCSLEPSGKRKTIEEIGSVSGPRCRSQSSSVCIASRRFPTACGSGSIRPVSSAFRGSLARLSDSESNQSPGSSSSSSMLDSSSDAGALRFSTKEARIAACSWSSSLASSMVSWNKPQFVKRETETRIWSGKN